MVEHTGQLRKTAKHSAIYAFGTMLRRLTGLVMLPIYTRYLTPADYGVVELLSMAIEISGILVGLRISQAMFRYYILAESEDDKRVIVSTVMFTVILSSGLGACFLYFSADMLSHAIFGSKQYVLEFQLFAFTLVTNAVTAVGLSYLRARQVPVLFVTISITSLLIQVGLNILFVVIHEMHVTGVVYSALISGVIISMGLGIYVLLKVGVHYSTELAWTLIKFVSPLILASIGAFYVAYADKYFLRLFGGLSDVGLYALAARVSSILGTVFEAFNMSWGADRFEIVKREYANNIFEQVYRIMSAILLVLGAAMAIFANDFFRLMTSPDFYSASSIVPILVIATLARINTAFCNFGALYGEQTSIMAKAAWIKTIVATVGYMTLIPYLSVYGAAIALMLSNLIETAWVYRQSKRFYDMGLKFRPLFLILIAVSMLVAFASFSPEGELTGVVVRLFWFLVMLMFIYWLPIWNDSERDILRHAGVRVLSRVRIVKNAGRSK